MRIQLADSANTYFGVETKVSGTPDSTGLSCVQLPSVSVPFRAQYNCAQPAMPEQQLRNISLKDSAGGDDPLAESVSKKSLKDRSGDLSLCSRFSAQVILHCEKPSISHSGSDERESPAKCVRYLNYYFFEK